MAITTIFSLTFALHLVWCCEFWWTSSTFWLLKASI